jgi:hypothetical protein
MTVCAAANAPSKKSELVEIKNLRLVMALTLRAQFTTISISPIDIIGDASALPKHKISRLGRSCNFSKLRPEEGDEEGAAVQVSALLKGGISLPDAGFHKRNRLSASAKSRP